MCTKNKGKLRFDYIVIEDSEGFIKRFQESGYPGAELLDENKLRELISGQLRHDDDKT